MKEKHSAPKAIPNPAPVPKGWPTLSDQALHGLPGDIVGMIQPHSEADPAALLGQSLVLFGNVVGRQPHVWVEADRHGLNLALAVVGDTSKARKGVSFGQARQVFSTADRAWMSERVQSGLSSGEGLIAAVADGIPPDPGVQDKRLLVFVPELGSFLNVMGRPGNSQCGVVRQAWDGETLQVMVKRFPQKATGAHVSIIAHTTRHDLGRYLSNVDVFNGFGNRFVWLCARRPQLLPYGGCIPGDELCMQRRRVKEAVSFARQQNEIKLSENARDLWAAEYIDLTTAEPGLLGAVTSRAEAQVLRVAGIYATMNLCSSIKTQHLRAALAFWAYCRASAKFIFGGRQELTLEERILAILPSFGQTSQGTTRTDISRALHNHQPQWLVSSALQNLQSRGLAKSRIRKTAGRSSEHWWRTENTQGKASD